MRYLLDANAISDLVRHPHGRVAQRIQRAGEDQVCTSIIVAAELRYGAAKKGSRKLTTRVGEALERIHVLVFEPPADEAYASLRAGLERAGQPIGANDMLIAAHALAANLTLVTDNMRDFKRIRDLCCENWLRRG
jgi:tRNA(fMet)-specific endonuclease VapC